MIIIIIVIIITVITYINKLDKVPSRLNNLKIKVDDLEVENCSCGFEKY